FVLDEADFVLVCSERLGDVLAARHRRGVTLVRQPRPRDAAPVDGPQDPAPSPGSPPTGASAEWHPVGGAAPPMRGGDGAPVRIGFFGSLDHAAFLDRLLA